MMPILVMGALSLPELREALAADADVTSGASTTSTAVAAAGGGRVHVKLDSGMGRLGTRDARRRLAHARSRSAGARSRAGRA